MTDEFVIEVAGETLNPIKRGMEQANQVVAVGNWLGKWGAQALDQLTDEEGQIQIESDLSALADIAAAIKPDALIDLYVVIFGVKRNFALKEFDVGDLIFGLTTIWEHQPTVQQMVRRFFSTPDLSDITDS